jgi:hypothetical protein
MTDLKDTVQVALANSTAIGLSITECQPISNSNFFSVGNKFYYL